MIINARRAVAFVVTFCLAALVWVASAPRADAVVLHSRSNSIVCSAWGGGAIRLNVDYYSWTDVGGTVWVQMKGGTSIHVDTLNSTFFDPEDFLLKNVDAADVYAEATDEAGGDNVGTYIFGGSPQSHALVPHIIQLSNGYGDIDVATTPNGESMPWTDSFNFSGGFLAALPEAQDIRIFFENESWLLADNATNRAWCSVRLVATS